MRFGVKALFRIETVFSDGRAPELLYEVLIINIDAENEEDALRRATDVFCETEWKAEAPAPHILLQTESFLGVMDLCDMGPPMDPHEVWYEYSATVPPGELRCVRSSSKP
ncbi:MAG: hypothetical protein HY791_26805 [Deltaproteobacteria bacterium]|nr:hypothetical protein [Deltaproteobacteria bacterium]